MLERYLRIYKAFTLVISQYAFIVIAPLILCLFYPEELSNSYGFLLPALLSAIIFLTGLIIRVSDPGTITYRDGAVLTIFTWIVISILSALPYMLIGNLTFSQSIFESVSGLTGTGLTMYTDVTKLSKLLLFWRSFTQWVGSAGFAVLMLGLVLGPRAAGFYKSEGRSDNLVPNIKRSAQIIVAIYVSYTVAGTIALKIAGMNWFEALNHTMTALATGGFSTRNGSIGEFNNLTIEIIVIILMFLGATGFGIHYAFWKGNIRAVLKNGEPWLMTISTFFFSIILTIYSLEKFFKNFGEGFRYIFFQTVSAVSGTGFQTLPLGEQKWISFSPFMFVLVMLMLAGGNMDSTSSGIKQFRIWIIINTIYDSIKNFILPKGTVKKKILFKGEQQLVIGDENVKEALLIFMMYILSLSIGSLILMLHGYDMERAIFEFASAMDGVGLSCGVTSPDMPLTAMWTLIIGMFAGRFEFLIVLYAIAKIISDFGNKSKERFLMKNLVGR
ncbi:MAG: TrkH family potassium uptake protein [Fervidobacterium gondwanense]